MPRALLQPWRRCRAWAVNKHALRHETESPNNTTKRRISHSRHWKGLWVFRLKWIVQRYGEEKEITPETLESAVACSDKTGMPNDTTKRRKSHSRHWKGPWVVQTKLDCPATRRREKNHTRDIEKGCGLFRQDRIAQ